MTATAGRWTKLHDSLINGRALSLSRDARLLGVEAEAWADLQETDGLVPRRALRVVTDLDYGEPFVAELVAAGRWAETDDGWEIIGFLDRHDSSSTRADDRAFNSARQRGYQRHAKGKHNPDGPRSCKSCESTRNAVNNTVRNSVNNDVDDTTRDETRRVSPSAYNARSASSSPPASSAPLARTGRVYGPMSEEQKQKIRDAHARRREQRAAREADAVAQRERMAAESNARAERKQRERDEEWLALGGDPSNLPASHEMLYIRRSRRKGMAPYRRPLR
jgi:hypothetical protein